MVKSHDETVIRAETPLLQGEDLSFGYGQRVLLSHLSLKIDAGEMVGLLGPNGSGKTTLLRLLSGLLLPWEGRVILQGRALQSWGRRAVAQRIAVVPQEFSLPFDFTVEHMVSLGRTPFLRTFFSSPTKESRRIVQEAMGAAGIASLADRIFNELSGGERQRVMIAMALAQQPMILLLDEPTAHLDIKYQIETLELVQQLNRERGVTIVAAMHDLNLAARYFPRLLLFQRGLVADASPVEILEPSLLKRVYGVNVQVGILRGAEHLSLLLPPESDKADRQGEPLIHVMAGGGSGELLMRALADASLPFVAGALSIGESDFALASRLAHSIIAEQPYAPLAPSTLEQVRTSLTRVALLVICPAPMAAGNLPLLQEAVHAAKRGLPIVLLIPATIKREEDISHASDSNAWQLIEQLLQAGAIVAASAGEAIDIIKRSLAKEDRCG